MACILFSGTFVKGNYHLFPTNKASFINDLEVNGPIAPALDIVVALVLGLQSIFLGMLLCLQTLGMNSKAI